MNEYPIDSNRFMSETVTAVYGIAPVVDLETGEHRRNRDGIPKWKVRLICEPVGLNGARRKPEFVEVNVACHEHDLDRTKGNWPTFDGLTVRQWSMTNDRGTSFGMSLSAQRVTFGPDPTAAAKTPAAA